MANLGMNFVPADVPDSDFTPLPVGQYVCMIVASEMTPTKDGSGQYLKLEIDVMDGEFKGRKLFERLNLQNQNEKAVAIAYQQLKKLCNALGLANVSDSNQLHSKRFIAEIDIEEGKPYTNKTGQVVDGRPQNRIRNFLPYSPQAASTASSSASPNAPWKNK